MNVFVRRLEILLNALCSVGDNIIICGDLNVNFLADLTDFLYIKFLVACSNFNSYLTEPRRKIDNIYTKLSVVDTIGQVFESHLSYRVRQILYIKQSIIRIMQTLTSCAIYFRLRIRIVWLAQLKPVSNFLHFAMFLFVTSILPFLRLKLKLKINLTHSGTPRNIEI